MNTEKLNKIGILYNSIAQESERLEKFQGNISVLYSLGTLRYITERLEKIKDILSTSKYDLAFIGEVGVGKTTAICHLFDLIIEKKEPNKKTGKIIKKMEELLSTGSGKTTICDVIIKPSNQGYSYFQIESYSEEEVTEFINEFCSYIWEKVYPNSKINNNNIPPAELRRAIRNIVDLNEINYEGKLKDKAIEFAKTFAENNYENFNLKVIEKANLSNRRQATKNYHNYIKDNNQYLSEKEWIKQEFSNLNLGKSLGFSIPKQITIFISSSILNFNKFTRFNSIIDTRGMDVVKDRKDLSQYIRDQKGTICIFAEKFPTAPKNVSELIGKYLTSESKDIDSKFCLLVMLRNDEAEKLMGADGQVNDKEEGIALRKSDINASFYGQKINFISENILFYDALEYYLSDGRLDPEYNEQEVVEKQQIMIQQIENIIIRREEKLWEEVESIEKIFNKIKTKQGFSQEENKLINDLKKTIKDVLSIEGIQNDFMSKYLKYLKSHHVMIFRATNNRFGIYDLRNVDFYFDSKEITENLIKQNILVAKSKILGEIKLVEEFAGENSALKYVMQIFSDQVDQYYQDMIIKIPEEISDFIHDKLLPFSDYNEFWKDIKDRWGKGKGYRDYVLNMYEDKLNEINNLINEKIKDQWENYFRKNVLAFLGE